MQTILHSVYYQIARPDLSDLKAYASSGLSYSAFIEHVPGFPKMSCEMTKANATTL